MTPDEYKKVRAVFDEALRHDPEERDAFLEGACVDKPWLRAEVSSLLHAHDDVGNLEGRTQAAIRLLADGQTETLEGRIVGPYVIRHVIGRGGMGVVYLADDTRLSRRVALKALSGDVSSDVVRRERLRHEARAAAALSHPGIATVYALEEIDGELYLACEYVPGQTLRAAIATGPLPLPQVIDIAIQLVKALAAAHSLNIVHRDLKPENIVRNSAGVVKVLDFGVARVENLVSSRLTQPAMLLGTPGYMAPEQVLGLEVDFRTDLFSFGVLVYEMLSGSNPYEAATVTATLAQILEHEPDSLSTVCPGCPLELSQIVTRCLRKDRSHRYDSTYELAGDLERLQAQVPVARARAEAGRAAVTTGVSRGAESLTPLWWWGFHQAVVSAVYIFTIYPAWRAREWLRPPWGNLLLLAILVCATIATSLRLHLWFTARFCPAELTPLRAKAFPWTRWSDAGFATALLLTGLGIGNAHPEVATLLITISIGAAVASFVIEPTTTRAAFRGRSGAIRTPHKARR